MPTNHTATLLFRRTLKLFLTISLIITPFIVSWQIKSTADASGSFLYGVNSNGNVIQIDTQNGTGTVVGSLNYGSYAAGYDADSGTVYYIEITGDNRVAAWDPHTNTSSNVSRVGIDIPAVRLAVHPNGTVYFMSLHTLYSLNKTHGTATMVGMISNLPFPFEGGDIAFSGDGTLYAFGRGGLYTIDISTRNATLVGTSDITPTGLAFFPNGTLYASTVSQLYTLNSATGEATLVGSFGNTVDDLFTLGSPIQSSTDIALSLAASAPNVQTNTPTTVTITATNTSATAASNVVIAIPLNSFSYISDTGAGAFTPVDGTWSIPLLSAGASKTLSLSLTAPTAGVRTLSATLQSLEETDTNEANNSGSATLTFTSPSEEPGNGNGTGGNGDGQGTGNGSGNGNTGGNGGGNNTPPASGNGSASINASPTLGTISLYSPGTETGGSGHLALLGNGGSVLGVESNRVCDYDCELVTYALYIVNPDGTKRHMNSEFARRVALKNGYELIKFEDAQDSHDRDFNDVVLQVHKTCEAIDIIPLEVHARWSHKIGIELWYDGVKVNDISLWNNSHESLFIKAHVDIAGALSLCTFSDSGEQEESRVVVYSEKNYEGFAETFYPGNTDADLRDNKIMNDRISSVKVFGKAIVDLFQHIHFKGTSETLTANDPDLSDNNIGDNSISSLNISQYGN